MSISTKGIETAATMKESEKSKHIHEHSRLSQLSNSISDTKICVLGLGYIGLPTASLLAARGYDVLGVDIREEIVESINAGNAHIAEPELDVLVRGAVEGKRLFASQTPAHADIYIIAVPTPFIGDHQPDLSHVETATRSIAPFLKEGNLVLLESTSPVGTTEKIAAWLAEERPDLAAAINSEGSNNCPKLAIAHCPERVLPGHIVRELVENDRIVGGIDASSTVAAAKFYRTFVNGEVVETNSRMAEMSKLAENTFRDINIAYANELSMICDEHEMDVWELIRLANLHPRVNILTPGPGVGGHCIAIDPWFLFNLSPQRSNVIHAARVSNKAKEDFVVELIESRLGKCRAIAFLGLSYKADVGDARESPSIRIIKKVSERINAALLVVDPFFGEIPTELDSVSDMEFCDIDEAFSRAEAVVVLVRHDFFRDYFEHHRFDGVVLDFVQLT